MCQGDDANCPDFEAHRAALRDDLNAERCAFLRSGFVATGGLGRRRVPGHARELADRQGRHMHYPVAIGGALSFVGDPHASQGDSELCGTAIECSMTDTFQPILHRKADLAGAPLGGLDFPMIGTASEWLMRGFSYPRLPAAAWSLRSGGHRRQVVARPRDARRLRVDFEVTQVVDASWGVHAIIKKAMFGA